MAEVFIAAELYKEDSMRKDARNNRKSGQGMTEYIIIVAVIAIACIAAYGLFGKEIKSTIGRIVGGLEGENKAAAGVTVETPASSMGDFSEGAISE